MDSAANAFVLALYRASRRLPHAQMRAFVFEGLKSLVPFDSAFWYRWAADAENSQMHAWCLYRQPDSLIHEYASSELWRDDVVYAKALASPSGTAVCASYSDYESSRMRDFLRRHRQEHILTIAIFQDVQGIASGMSLYRNETRTTYTEVERVIVESVMPHLVEAWRENWLHDVVREASRSPERVEFSLAVVVPGPMLSEAQDNFGELMHLEWPQWRGPRLPEPVQVLLAKSARIEPTEVPAPWVGESIAIYHRHQPDGTTLIFVRRGHPFDRLAPRKREAALLFARGASQTEVAVRMQLSPSTVNNYLGGVYEQLQLTDKTGLSRLVARLEP